jgi:hypothetical protein
MKINKRIEEIYKKRNDAHLTLLETDVAIDDLLQILTKQIQQYESVQKRSHKR